MSTEHLVSSHGSEPEVQRMLALNKQIVELETQVRSLVSTLLPEVERGYASVIHERERHV